MNISLRLGKTEATQKCPENLYFAEPGDAAEGDRVFDIALQRKLVLKDFDIRKAAGGRNRVFVRGTEGVVVGDTIDVAFTPRSGRALLCGIEIVMVGN